MALVVVAMCVCSCSKKTLTPENPEQPTNPFSKPEIVTNTVEEA